MEWTTITPVDRSFPPERFETIEGNVRNAISTLEGSEGILVNIEQEGTELSILVRAGAVS